MKLTWHIVLNDLRRLRLPLVLWTALLAAKIGLGAVLLWGGTGGKVWVERLSGTGYLLSALEVVVGYVLVAWLIHGDMPTGTTAFWMTRPLSGPRLLTAKLLGLTVIFGVAPLVVTGPWWLACDYGPRELMLAAGETLALQAVVVVFAVPLAVLTNEFSRYLMWTLVLVVALFASSLSMIVVPGIGAAGAANAGLIATRGWLALALLLLGGGVAAVHQFCTRRFLYSLVTVGVGLVVALGTLNYWPLDLVRKEAPPVDQPGRLGASVRLELQSARTVESPGADTELHVGVRLGGAPTDLLLASGNVEHRWSWADGAAVQRSGWISGTSAQGPAVRALGLEPQKPNLEFEKYVAERRRQRGFPALPESQPGLRNLRVTLPPSVAARMHREPPSYLLRAHFYLYRPAVVGETTPRVGATLAGDPDHLRLVRLGFDKDRLTITMVERRSLLFWDVGQIDPVSAFLMIRGGWQTQPQYFLVNRGRGNVSDHQRRGWSAARVGTVGIFWQTLSFSAPQDYHGEGKWVSQAGWFDGATLAKVAFREEERITTELHAGRFDVVKRTAKKGAP